MTSRELMMLALAVADDLELYARKNDLGPEEILTAAVMAERLISRTYPGTPEALRATVFEAQATFDALTMPPEVNERN